MIKLSFLDVMRNENRRKKMFGMRIVLNFVSLFHQVILVLTKICAKSFRASLTVARAKNILITAPAIQHQQAGKLSKTSARERKIRTLNK
jgi:hypothetical protein